MALSLRGWRPPPGLPPSASSQEAHVPSRSVSGDAEDDIAHHRMLDEGTWYIQEPLAIDALAREAREVLDTEG